MLGSFLEFSVSVDDVGRALEFYRALGFQDLPTGDFIAAPYAALWDGAVVIGLRRDALPTSLRFVRPRLKEHLPALRRLHIDLESTELAADAFNRAAFVDSAGLRVELLEARTYSPAAREPSAVATCGTFVELSLPTYSADASAAFWERLGFGVVAVATAPYPRVRLTGAGCTLGFHQAPIVPGISFVSANVLARIEFMRAKGLQREPGTTPALGGTESARFPAPGGTAVYLHGPAG